MANRRPPHAQGADDLLGDVRVHQIVQGQLAVLDARDCSHCWKVFHTTYSFCLVLRLAPTIVRWKYNRRTYEVDSRRPVMVMQPGEVHANLQAHPPADFIVVQVGDELMKEIARGLGWRSHELHIKEPDCSHPALVRALAAFRRGLCMSLYDTCAPGGRCSCACSLDVHLENLVGIVAAFIEHGAESAREVPLRCNGAALVSHAVQFLLESPTQPYPPSSRCRPSFAR